MNLVFRNLSVTLLTQLFTWAVTFVVTLFVPRYVGAVGLGQLAFASSFISIFCVVAPLGLSGLLIKEIARDRDATLPLIRAALLLRLPLAVVLSFAAVMVVWMLHYPADIRVLVIISGIAALLANANDVLNSALLGREDLPRQSRSVVIERILTAVLTLSLVFLGAPLWALATVGAVAGLVTLGVNLTAFPALRSWGSSVKQIALWDLARRGLPFLGWSVFQTLYGKTDPVILRLIANDATVGWYDASNRLAGTTLFIPVALGAALAPTLNRLYTSDREKFRELSNRFLALVLICGIPIALVLICVPDLVLGLLRYPAGFSNCVPVMRFGGVAALLWYVAIAVGTTVSAADGQAGMCRAAVYAAILGVPWCFLASTVGYRFFGNGAAGAVLSDAVLEVGLIFAYVRLLPRGFYGVGSVRLIFRCLLAAVPMIGALVLGRAYLGLWVLLPAALLYAIGCVVFRCVDKEYIGLLRGMLAKKFA